MCNGLVSGHVERDRFRTAHQAGNHALPTVARIAQDDADALDWLEGVDRVVDRVFDRVVDRVLSRVVDRVLDRVFDRVVDRVLVVMRDVARR